MYASCPVRRRIGRMPSGCRDGIFAREPECARDDACMLYMLPLCIR